MSITKSLTTSAFSALKNTTTKRAFASAVESSPPSPFPTSVQAFIRDFKTNEPVRIMNLNKNVFGAPLRRDILHRVVVWQRDGMRQGTASTKTRSEVAGSTRKRQPQKGTGKARQSDGKAPHFRGGGVAFGPKPRDHSTDLPRKVQEFGLRIALSSKYAQDQMVIVKSLENFSSLKTHDLHNILKTTYNSPKTLVILNDYRNNFELAARNLPNCEILYVEETNVLDLLAYDKVIIERSAVKTLEEALTPIE
ncbi:ribosomal protein L4 domain-containing protein [Mycotypha africana]|uniref:ribosomal protein L4 domain-containing protein n=1 Tax=Mycotypha africana TaxID=64632 RepID=UPI00230123D4|nr:ribosomal protein L4 domain-containing protein [Mycotypha africana]KAI8973313.1 ribosomal protein L4 domain-containing protein [Mycotypha africana]